MQQVQWSLPISNLILPKKDIIVKTQIQEGNRPNCALRSLSNHSVDEKTKYHKNQSIEQVVSSQPTITSQLRKWKLLSYFFVFPLKKNGYFYLLKNPNQPLSKDITCFSLSSKLGVEGRCRDLSTELKETCFIPLKPWRQIPSSMTAWSSRAYTKHQDKAAYPVVASRKHQILTRCVIKECYFVYFQYNKPIHILLYS